MRDNLTPWAEDEIGQLRAWKRRREDERSHRAALMEMASDEEERGVCECGYIVCNCKVDDAPMTFRRWAGFDLETSLAEDAVDAVRYAWLGHARPEELPYLVATTGPVQSIRALMHEGEMARASRDLGPMPAHGIDHSWGGVPRREPVKPEFATLQRFNYAEMTRIIEAEMALRRLQPYDPDAKILDACISDRPVDISGLEYDPEPGDDGLLF